MVRQRPHKRTVRKTGKSFRAGRGMPAAYVSFLKKANAEKQEYNYDWKGYGLILWKGLSKPDESQTVFLQGDEASELFDQLEAAKKNWQVNRLIEPYF